MPDKATLRASIITFLVLAGLFLLISNLITEYHAVIQNLIAHTEPWGRLLYVLFIVFEAIVAPLNSIPFVPIATGAWGVGWAIFLTLIGWMIGSTIAFLLAQRFGPPIVRHFGSLAKIQDYSRLVPDHHQFIAIVIIRLFIPIDLMSYAIGLGTFVRLRTYLWASLIGYLPWAFVWSYASTFSLGEQLLLILVGLIALVFQGIWLRHRLAYASK